MASSDFNYSHKLIDYDNFDYSQTALIKPPSQIFHNENKANRKTVRLVVDSRDRNMTLFPNPNSYEIELIDEIQDVVSVKLCHTVIPFTDDLINQSNCKLHFSVNSNTYECSLDTGTYTETQLCDALIKKMNKTVGSDMFKIFHNTINDKFSIRCIVPFELFFMGETINHSDGNRMTQYIAETVGKVLGFGIKNYKSVQDLQDLIYTSVIEAPFKKNFKIEDYVILHISPFYVNVSINDAINKSFAVIPKSFTHMNIHKEDTVRKYCNPPIPRLTKLRLSFKTYHGKAYDFQNQEHRLELELECLKNCRKYQSFANS